MVFWVVAQSEDTKGPPIDADERGSENQSIESAFIRVHPRLISRPLSHYSILFAILS